MKMSTMAWGLALSLLLLQCGCPDGPEDPIQVEAVDEDLASMQRCTQEIQGFPGKPCNKVCRKHLCYFYMCLGTEGNQSYWIETQDIHFKYWNGRIEYECRIVTIHR